MPAAAQYEFLVLLLLATLVLELVARRLRLPPAAAFIVGGVAIALLPGVPAFAIDPDLVSLIFMPFLLIPGAYFTVWREFRDNLSGIPAQHQAVASLSRRPDGTPACSSNTPFAPESPRNTASIEVPTSR